MGIKNYCSNLLDLYTNISSKKTPSNIDLLCIDINTILHNICNKSTNNEQFKNNLTKELSKIIKKINPKGIALFADGQAPLAKAKLQIKRRQKVFI